MARRLLLLIILIILLVVLSAVGFLLYFINPKIPGINKTPKEILGLKEEPEPVVDYVEADDLETIKSTINMNTTILSSLENTVTDLKNKLDTIQTTYIDKTKPISLLSNSCNDKNSRCIKQPTHPFWGNAHRSLSYDQKAEGLGLHIGHSPYVESGKSLNYNKWYINQ